MSEESRPTRPLHSLELTTPISDLDWERYYDLRWQVLRKPWNKPRGSERDEIEQTSFHLMLREPSGKVAAIGRLHLNSTEEAQVRYMAVAESWRGQGLGARILQGLEEQARTQSVQRIVLNAREMAINFYIRQHYRIEGPAEKLFGEIRHVRMRKEI
ncbi:MAG: GNAT family N-acetyltransferase [Verrucomicrobiota bacterium]